MEALVGVSRGGGVARSSAFSSFVTEIGFEKSDRREPLLSVRCDGKREFGKPLRVRKRIIERDLFPRTAVLEPPVFVDRSHEQFYSLRVVCGKKDKAEKIDKLREMVRTVRRDLQPLQGLGSQHSVAVIDGESEAPACVSLSNRALIEAALKQLADIEAEMETLQVKSKQKKGSSSSSSRSSSSSSESSDSDPGMDMRNLRKSKPGVKELLTVSSQSPASMQAPGVLGTAVVLPQVPEAAQQVLASSVIPFQEEEEPEIIAQIRALCNSANVGGVVALERESPRCQAMLDTPTPAWSSSLLLPGATRQVEMTGNIEVCIGGKCKKGGAQRLLASFQENLPESSAAKVTVTSCKCMGKCKSAANVRVQRDEADPQLHSHVLEEDVGTLLQLHFGLGNSPGTQRPVFTPSKLVKMNSSTAAV